MFKVRAWQSWDLNSGLNGLQARASCLPLPAPIMYLRAYSFSCLVLFLGQTLFCLDNNSCQAHGRNRMYDSKVTFTL